MRTELTERNGQEYGTIRIPLVPRPTLESYEEK